MVLDLDRVVQAAAGLPDAFVRTPQYRSDALSRLLGIEVILKVETINPTGTVASRGAEWWFECHPDVHRVVCASADDFGGALSHAGRVRGGMGHGNSRPGSLVPGTLLRQRRC